MRFGGITIYLELNSFKSINYLTQKTDFELEMYKVTCQHGTKVNKFIYINVGIGVLKAFLLLTH